MRRKTFGSTGTAIVALLALTPSFAAPLADVYERVKDSVVLIETIESLPPGDSGARLSAVGGLGSGVLVSAEGRVLTAAHVVQVAEVILVHLPAGETIGARVVTSEPWADVALLQLERPPAAPVVAAVGDSDRARVGDEVLVVGAPLGIGHTLTAGHISGRRAVSKLYGGFSTAELLQTDAAINPGNSGGPMFNLDGEVIGIVSHILSRSGGSEGLGFVVSSNVAHELLLGRRRWTGMQGLVLEGPLARALQLPQSSGILVMRIAPGSPAARLGLVPGSLPARIGDDELLLGGDVILEVQGIPIGGAEAARRIEETLNSLKSGSQVSLVVLRGGRRIELVGEPWTAD